jgi:hypothetical protein
VALGRTLEGEEKFEVARMLHSHAWGVVLQYLCKEAKLERSRLLGGTPANSETVLDLRAAQAKLRAYKNLVDDLYRAVDLNHPPDFDINFE